MKKLTVLAVLSVTVLVTFAPRVTNAQGTAFTYQGFLLDNAAPAKGSYDLQFSLFSSATDGVALTTPVAVDDLNVTNGLFTTVLDFGAAPFTGAARWVEIGVRPGASTGGYTALVPRQPITSVPYAIFAGGVSAAGITGTIPAGNIGSDTITSNMLAPGAAAANLSAGGQAGVPSGGVVFSSIDDDTNLLANGYIKIGGSVSAQNVWKERTPVSPLAPRLGHTALWTGSRMLVWGGTHATPSPTIDYNDGATYDPVSNQWTLITTNGTPIAREYFASVWTGNQMLVWGGYTYDGSYHYYQDGGRYNLASNTWAPISTNGAPAGRYYFTGVWTGTELIVWGGMSSDGSGFSLNPYNNGGRYNPTTDSWLPLSLSSAPSPRALHSAVWTGTEMIVYGGQGGSGLNTWLNNGARYNPTTDTWTPINFTNNPGTKSRHTAVWTGT